jgi:hypothetical protein
MIVGENRTIEHTESSSDGTAFTATATLVILKPDQTTEQNPPVVAVTPGTPATEQFFDARYLFAQAGGYYVEWHIQTKINNADSDSYIRPIFYFAAFTDVYRIVRRLLSKSELQLPEVEINPILADVLTDLEDDNTLLETNGGYVSLQKIGDRVHADQAIAYMSAALLLSENPQKFLGGAIRSIADAQIRYDFAVATPGSVQQTKAEMLFATGWQSLQRISFLSDALKANPPVMFGLAGTNRGVNRSLGRVNNYAMPLYGLLVKRGVLL